jgi:hypothetical protein
MTVDSRRTVADRSPQRVLYKKHETTSPIFSSDLLMLSIVVDAHEGRDVATSDVTGVYLCAYMGDKVIMKFTIEYVEIMCVICHENEVMVIYENGLKVLYVLLKKAMYSCDKSSFL